MRLVSIVAKENFLSIMSDDDSLLGNGTQISNEEYHEYVAIGDFGYLAYGGDRSYGERLSQEIRTSFSEKTDFEEIVSYVENSLTKADFKSRGGFVTVSFGGVNSKGNIELFSITSEFLDMHRMSPSGRDYRYCVLYNEGKDDKRIESEIIFKYLKETGHETPSQVIQAQKLLNNHTAANDKNVNRKTSKLLIKK